jgi:hypothetical protein
MPRRAAPRFPFCARALLAAPLLATEPAVTNDPDAIGPDGMVWLRCYLPMVRMIQKHAETTCQVDNRRRAA